VDLRNGKGAALLRPSVYFACAISPGRQDAHIYNAIAAELGRYARVLTPQFAALNFVEERSLSAEQINRRDLDRLVRADALVAEITVPSLGVGYEISKAESWGTPVLCLYRDTASLVSPMITGATGVASVRYNTPRDIRRVIEPFFAALRDRIETRHT
jgi:nucleoside 2-deoxyribosyltransferase